MSSSQTSGRNSAVRRTSGSNNRYKDQQLGFRTSRIDRREVLTVAGRLGMRTEKELLVFAAALIGVEWADEEVKMPVDPEKLERLRTVVRDAVAELIDTERVALSA